MDRRLSGVAVNKIVQSAVVRGGLVDDERDGGYSAHSLPGRVRHLRALPRRLRPAIAHQTRHRSLHTVGSYIRVDTGWDDNAGDRSWTLSARACHLQEVDRASSRF